MFCHGFHPLKARQPGQFLTCNLSTVRGALHSGDQNCTPNNIFLNSEEFVAHAKSVAPRALSVAQRTTFFLDPEPPAWCVEMEKWPYQTPAWKQWLADRKVGKKVKMSAE
jgi:hypothetical protein